MTTVTLRLNKEEQNIFEEVVDLYGGKLSTAIKQLALDKIQEEYDLQLIRDFEEREKNNEVEFITFDDLRKDLNL
jgi:hypothetical protein